MSNIIPALRYLDAPAAISWLCEAFGFQRHAVYEGPDGTIVHAELRLGTGFVMLGSAKDDDLLLMPAGVLGGSSSAIYVCVADADAHFAKAKAAGAEILREIADTPYGSREYSCRDIEGHLWSFGTYMPQSTM